MEVLINETEPKLVKHHTDAIETCAATIATYIGELEADESATLAAHNVEVEVWCSLCRGVWPPNL